MPTLADLPYALIVGTAVAMGLAFGSFLNVVIWRWPRGENIAFPASHCTSCGTPIKGYDNLPLIGWLLLRGRARCCKAKISARYPLVEAIGGLLAWAIVSTIVLALPPETPWWRAGLSFVLHLALGLGLVAAAFIDLDHLLLPDEITLGGALLGLASVPLRAGASFVDALLGAAFGFVVVWLPFVFLYEKVRGRAGMGLGDAKLTMLAGAWFGWPGAAFALLGGAVQGTLGAIAVFAARGRIEEPEAVTRERDALLAEIAAAEGAERARLEAELAADPIGAAPEPGLGAARMPFGPFLVLAIVEWMLFGPVIADAVNDFVTP